MNKKKMKTERKNENENAEKIEKRKHKKRENLIWDGYRIFPKPGKILLASPKMYVRGAGGALGC